MNAIACYRLGRQYLILGVVCLALFLAMDIGSIHAAYWNVDGSFPRPVLAAWIVGVFWSLWVLLALWMIIAYFRERLFVTPDAITQVGCFGETSIIIAEVTQIVWRRFPGRGSVIVRSDFRRIKIYLSNFTGNEQDQIIAHLRHTFSTDIQADWTPFIESWLQSSAPQRKFGAGVLCTLILFSFAVVFGYCWFAGLGSQWLVISILNSVGGMWYARRLINWQHQVLAKPPA